MAKYTCLCLLLLCLFSLNPYESKSLFKSFKFTDHSKHFINLEQFVDSPFVKEIACFFCDVGGSYFRDLVLKNKTQFVDEATKYACILLKIEDKVVCNQIVNLYAGVVESVAFQSTVTVDDVCKEVLDCGPVESPLLNWNITLPNVPKPPVVPPVPPQPGSPTLRILHLTDIHIDFEYQPGALAKCDQPLCCRNTSTYKSSFKGNDTDLAGYYGDYRNCDAPLWTIENLFQHLSENETFDFIYWTGDLPPHNVWNQTKSDQVYALRKLTQLFIKYFPNSIIYPTLGNHEAAPCNLFPIPQVKGDNITWLYTELANDWTQTGLPNNLTANITRGAFYTLVIRPGLRLISLNMNYCPALNFWLFINSTDPLNQLEWLSNILQEAENNGEKVHIIGHINPAGCLDSWSDNYYRIISRYNETVVGQFFGHTHNDEYEIFYDYETSTTPVGIAYISGSVTPFSFNNPNYRIYTIDGAYENSSYQLLDHETHIMNLTEANLSMKPVWYKEYSAKDAFNMTTLYPADWNNLINSAFDDLNGNLTDKLYTYFYKSSDAIKECDQTCRKDFLCSFKQARPNGIIEC